jgi:hypothetical protein
MVHHPRQDLRLRFLTGFTALALLAGCASSRLVSQWSNSEYAGKPFKSILVVAVTQDEVVRRTFEDGIVAHLGKRGRKGIPAYSLVSKRGKIEEAELRQAIAQSGAEGVLLTRVTGVGGSTTHIPSATLTVGVGWGGFYGSYVGMWETSTRPAQDVTGPSWTRSETRLFDAKNGALAWTGIVDTPPSDDDLAAALARYINLIFDAMVSDRIL